MASVADILLDAFDRIGGDVHGAVEGLSDDQLAERLDPQANSIAWLVWHLSRVQDDHIAGVFGRDQRWTAGGWAERFALPFDDAAHGYGQSSEDVARVRVGAAALLGYLDEVQEYTARDLRTLTEADLDRVVDDAWDPPVTAAVRIMSVINDCTQHAGQAAFVRGVVLRG